MSSLWEIGLEGETRLERAIEYAWKTPGKNGMAPLFECIADTSYDFDNLDRLRLALFIRDGIRRGRGRPSHSELSWIAATVEFDKKRARRAPIDRALLLYAYIMYRRRTYGRRVRGTRDSLVRALEEHCKLSQGTLSRRLHDEKIPEINRSFSR